MDKKTQTIQTYSQSAQALAEKFDRLGARTSDIEEVFALLSKDDPRVLEIGCGNGRDAEVIHAKTNAYLGIDASEGLVALAQTKVPDAKFQVADVETYVFPSGLDAVFAFASLIHSPKEVLRDVFVKIFDALNPGGLFRLSMKCSDVYREVTKQDEFGTRTYYHYSPEDLVGLDSRFVVLKCVTQEYQNQTWVEVLLQKPKA
jgi:trans-aconitate methyltransferase